MEGAQLDPLRTYKLNDGAKIVQGVQFDSSGDRVAYWLFDEHPNGSDEGRPTIRLGFAHSGLDRRLAEKAKFADLLTTRYAALGVKVLVTAAAIGIDEVRVREPIPLHRDIRQKLFDSDVEAFPGSKASQPPDSRATRLAGRPLPARHTIRAFRPLTVPLDDPMPEAAVFERGEKIRPSYALRTSFESVVRLSWSVITAPSSLRFGFGRERIFSTVSSRSSVPSRAK